MTLAETFGGSREPLVDVVGMGAVDLAVLSRELEATRRWVAAQEAMVMAEMARQQTYTADGHSDVRGWYRATHRWSTAEASAMRRLSRLGAVAPQVLDELAAGRLGVFQAGVLARAFANPRVSEQLLGVLDGLFEHAAKMKAHEFEQVVDTWVTLVDDDGSFDDRERARDARSASLGESDMSFVLRLFGPAIDGEHLRRRLQRYIDAEWKLDWARCVADHGDQATPAKMARTGEQRRYDAFMRMIFDPNPIADTEPATEPEPETEPDVDETVDEAPAETAAPPVARCSCGGRRGGGPESVTNLMIDIATFEHILDRMFRRTSDPPAGLLTGDGRPIRRPDDLRRWLSQTTDGRFIPPEDIVLEAIFGRVRVVITDERGVVWS